MPQKILIIGAGPSGASAAILLSTKGFQVTLIDRKSPQASDLKIGESLPPNARQLLIDLEVWDEFQTAGHLECYGNKSIWGSSTITHTDFIHHPVGHGWHLDRGVFDAMLIEKAKSLGVEFLVETTLTNAVYKNETWEVALKNKEQASSKKNYAFLVDASGRNSYLSRKLGIERLYESQQLALIAFLKTNKTFEDGASLIETTSEGWWYSAKIPGERIVTAFLCRPEKSKRNLWTNEKEWQALVNKATHTAQRIQDAEAELLVAPRFIAADSSILETTYGEGWLAIGDAAMTYDPIASHGILMGMVSARDASKAIEEYLTGNQKSLEAYNALLWTAFQYYVKQRDQFYLAEQRFEDSDYWNSAIKSQKSLS